MTYTQRNKNIFIYIFFNVILYIILLYSSELIITKGIIFLACMSFATYYFTDIFSIISKRSINIIITGFLVNLILFTVFTLKVGLKNVKEAAIIYIPMFLMQTLIKDLFFIAPKEKKKIFLFGNEIEKTLIERSALESKGYKLEGFESNILELGSKLDTLFEEKKLDALVLSSNIDIPRHLMKNLLDLKLQGVKVYNFSEFYEILEEKIPVNSINEDSLLYSEGFEIVHNTYQQNIKRLSDIIISSAVLLMTAPIMLISILIIKFESKGPVFFIQERVGKGNRPFKILKFRSMRADAEQNGPQWAKEKDNRVTVFGKIMRKTRIDELPQLINILKGEMSFIGPRPERQYFISMLEKDIPFYNLRHSILPGLTGWAQVNYSYGASTEDALEKLKYDLYYIKHQSIILDIIIVLKTLRVVFLGKGR